MTKFPLGPMLPRGLRLPGTRLPIAKLPITRLPSGLGETASLVGRALREVGRGVLVPPPRGDGDGDELFLTCHLGPQAGGRMYKLYVPAGARGRAAPLVVMLHGCTQSPDDFATGTRMNALAEEHGCLIAYPEQIAAANSARCWNWFNTADQHRDRGEPALIAAITREVMARHQVDARRVYVAGLSAGGAAAAVMAATYPDLYAAIGVHSGLACGAARDVASAMTAMRDGATDAARAAIPVPAIIFHGDRDSTVNPRNADAVLAQLMPREGLTPHTTRGQVPGGHAWRRTVFADRSGRERLEQWDVTGLGHAWSGGDRAGSYTDPAGPDASREMLRFFLDQTHK